MHFPGDHRWSAWNGGRNGPASAINWFVLERQGIHPPLTLVSRQLAFPPLHLFKHETAR